MAITDLQAAQEMATKYPELHESRQIAFGENYLQDLEKGTGTSQYYTGFGLAPDWVTGAIGAPAEAPIVQEPTAGDAQVAEQIAEGDRGITGASAIQPTISDPFLASGAAGGARLPTMDQAGAVAAMTQPEAYNIPGTMPQTPVSGAWGPQEYLQPQGPRVELPSGDVFAADDPMLQEKMDYTQQDEGFWDDVKNTFNTEGLTGVVTNFGQSVANTLSALKDQGIDISKMAAGAIMNAIKPGLGLAARLMPETSPIDKFYNQYQVGGDFYEDIVEDDPKFEKRLEGYSDTLQAGTIDQDPFGKNTTSALGDYPAYATQTYNDIVAKEKAGKELSQFDKDRKEYYGHISGLTGETNIPGTPLMVGDPVYGDYGDEDIITPPEKPETYQEKADKAWEDIIEVQTIAGNDIYVNKITGEVFPSAAELIAAAEADATKADKDIDSDFSLDFPDITEIKPTKTEESGKAKAEKEMQEAIAEAEAARAAEIAREEAMASQWQNEYEAEQRAAEAAQAAANAAAAQAAERHSPPSYPSYSPPSEQSGGSAQGGGYGGPAGGHHWSKGGRVRYSNGGIVDLL
jgi:hypothetical protein